MMLLRMCEHIVNMDQLLSIYDAGDKYLLKFGHGQHGNDHHTVQLDGEAREAFAHWLDEHAIDLMPHNCDDKAWQEYKALKGDMTRAEWESTRGELWQVLEDLQHNHSQALLNRASNLEFKLGY